MMEFKEFQAKVRHDLMFQGRLITGDSMVSTGHESACPKSGCVLTAHRGSFNHRDREGRYFG